MKGTAKCPACGGIVNVGQHPKLGHIVRCYECDSQLEITWLDPVELDWPYETDDYESEDGYESDYRRLA